MKPSRLAKAVVLSMLLGAIFSVGSDPNIMDQVQAIAFSKVQAVGSDAWKAVSSKFGEWLGQRRDTGLNVVSD